MTMLPTAQARRGNAASVRETAKNETASAYDATPVETITRYAIELFGIRIISFLRREATRGSGV
jgi:hypothetical protein